MALSSNRNSRSSEKREDYKAWKKGKDKTEISPKERNIKKITKRRYVKSTTKQKEAAGEYWDPDTGTGKKDSKTSRLEGGRGILDQAPGGKSVKRKGIFRGLLGRKTEKGFVKEQFDPNLTEYDEDTGLQKEKYGLSKEDRKAKRKAGRKKEKYIAQGLDEYGEPLKTKKKTQGKGEETVKEKSKRAMKLPKGDKKYKKNPDGSLYVDPKTDDYVVDPKYLERKYVKVVDGKRVKSRGMEEESGRGTRQYIRKGFRRQYIDPDKEGKITYLSGKEVKKKPRREKGRK
tara:strand:+ start:160 stop:1020 length:861 start_codon:yes stop_codon:yes gene_type:complete